MAYYGFERIREAAGKPFINPTTPFLNLKSAETAERRRALIRKGFQPNG